MPGHYSNSLVGGGHARPISQTYERVVAQVIFSQLLTCAARQISVRYRAATVTERFLPQASSLLFEAFRIETGSLKDICVTMVLDSQAYDAGPATNRCSRSNREWPRTPAPDLPTETQVIASSLSRTK